MDDDCTIYRTANFIGKRWTLLILLELFKGPKLKRYCEIKKGLEDITPKVLSLRLKELEKEGLIHKDIDAGTFPVKCEYSLTKSGEDFMAIIKDIKRWALRWKLRNKVCENADCRNCTL